MRIEKITAEDTGQIKELIPQNWSAVPQSIKIYLETGFCHSIKLVENNDIRGIGTAIFYKNTSWLAHIIVKEEYRNKGYGTRILKYLVDHCAAKGCATILLFATDMGYPLYKKYGFEIQAEYCKYEKTVDKDYPPNVNIKIAEKRDHERILELDRAVSGEDRRELLREFMNGSYVYRQNDVVTGYYIYGLHDGPVIADTEEAGLELLKLRTTKEKYAVLPEENHAGINFYRENSFTETMRMKRMIYGKKIECHNARIYNRIGGNFG